MNPSLILARFFGLQSPMRLIGFVLVHNHPSGVASPSEADLQLTKRLVSAAGILQINFLDHVIVGQAMSGGKSFFSFQEAGLL
jgi:DNA repair protein RadC